MNSTCEENKSSPYRQTLQIQNRTAPACAASSFFASAFVPFSILFVRFPFPFSFSFLSWMLTCTDWILNSYSTRDGAISAFAKVVGAYHELLESCAQVFPGVTSDRPTPEMFPFPSPPTPTRKAPLCDELL